MGKLSTHVLDIASGNPAGGMRVDLFRLKGDKYVLLKTLVTNDDGRTEALLLDSESMEQGEYELLFYVSDYFSANNTHQAAPAFLDKVPVRFGIADASAGYHVPLLVSPWSYSTYRGS